MYFKQIDEIVQGVKTQTRRIVKPGEVLTHINGESRRNDFPAQFFSPSVLTSGGRLKWQVGRDYAVSPGRGKPGVWWKEHTPYKVTIREWQLPPVPESRYEYLKWHPLRIVITDIRREPLQAISETDAIAEGYPTTPPQPGITIMPPVVWYRELWTMINGRGSWDTNPDVWVLTFEVRQA